MNLKIFSLSLIGVIVMIGVFMMTRSSSNCVENSLNYDARVQPNQVWIKADSTDPFKPVMIDTIKVLDVRKDYSLILMNQDTFSIPSKFVTINSKQIK
jgi:hypothetical protein